MIDGCQIFFLRLQAREQHTVIARVGEEGTVAPTVRDGGPRLLIALTRFNLGAALSQRVEKTSSIAFPGELVTTLSIGTWRRGVPSSLPSFTTAQ